MQVDVEQRRRARPLRHNMIVADFFDDGARFHIAFTTASPASDVLAVPFKSAVTLPEFKTASTAPFTAAASSFSPKLYSSIAATEPIAPNGLAVFCPAMSGAEPCTGSYKPTHAPEGFWSPIDAEGSMPIDPAKTAP